jgi:hypothetical protein
MVRTPAEPQTRKNENQIARATLKTLSLFISVFPCCVVIANFFALFIAKGHEISSDSGIIETQS